MKQQLDLVLVNPASGRRIYQKLADTLTAVEPPVWAGLMATFVRRRGFTVSILDVNAENLTPAEAADQLEEMNPHLIAIVVYGHQPSASTQMMPGASAVCDAIKARNPQRRVLLVGGHVAALPARTLREESADFVSGGEGLYTMVELLGALQAGADDDIAKVRGLWYRDGDAIRSTPPAPLVTDVENDAPMLAWDLLPMEKYRAHNWHCFGDLNRAPYASIYTTLGCPYHCSFCCIQAPFKSGEKLLGMKETTNSYRFWKPELVADQIDLLVEKYGVRNIKFADEMFVLNPRHVLGICDRLIERGHDLNIWAYARVDTVKEGMLEKLKKAGFNWLAFGIESGSDRVRDGVDKSFSQDDIFKTLERVRAEGINVAANSIFGLPDDDAESMKATLDLALDVNAEWANFYCTMAYPGSPLYEQASRDGWTLPSTWSGYSQHAVDSTPLPTRHLPAREVLRFRDAAFDTYFTGTRFLEMITRKFGVETADHIREMASYRLERNDAGEKPTAVVR